MHTTVCHTCHQTYTNDSDFLKFGKNFKICSEGHLWFDCICNSCLVIMKENCSWYQPERFMSEEAKSIFLKIKNTGRVPYIPNEVAKLIALISSENSTSKRIETELKKIPSLAYNVLEMANNLKATSDQKITKLEHAISYLGHHTLSSIVMSASLKNFKFSTKLFNHEKFWQEARVAGIIAEYLVDYFAKQLEADESYLAASLCNIGKVVGAIALSEEIDQIYQLVQTPSHPLTWEQAEKKINAISHTVLGEIAAVLWGLPEFIADSIKYHHLLASEIPDLMTKQTLEFTEQSQEVEIYSNRQKIAIHDIAALANQYCHWVMLEPHRIDSKLLGSYGQRLGLGYKETEQVGGDIMIYMKKHHIIN